LQAAAKLAAEDAERTNNWNNTKWAEEVAKEMHKRGVHRKMDAVYWKLDALTKAAASYDAPGRSGDSPQGPKPPFYNEIREIFNGHKAFRVRHDSVFVSNEKEQGEAAAAGAIPPRPIVIAVPVATTVPAAPAAQEDNAGAIAVGVKRPDAQERGECVHCADCRAHFG
jgi:hypothetical protein